MVIFLNDILSSIRREFSCDELKQLTATAYPRTIPDSGAQQTASAKPEPVCPYDEARHLMLARHLAVQPDTKVACRHPAAKTKVMCSFDLSLRPSLGILGHLAKLRDLQQLGWEVVINFEDVLTHMTTPNVSLVCAKVSKVQLA